MAKPKFKENPRTVQVFDDLDAYRDFCREFGHVFDEAHLYKHNTPWSYFHRYKQGRPARDNWAEDAKRLAGRR